MKYTLMHKRKEVAEMDIDEATGYIQKIEKVYAPEHLPIGIPYRQGTADRGALNEWWTARSIPASRLGVRSALETLKISDTKLLLIRCFGLSLSDQYWIAPKGEKVDWGKINFFENDFSEDIGDILFGGTKKLKNFDFSSPDNTSDGNLKKRWKIIDGKRCLIKGGSNLERQQPFNEVIASEIAERLGIPHAQYKMLWTEGEPYSICEDFITEETELISAWRIMQTQKKENNVSVYRHFINCCEELGIRDIIPALDKMIVLDYIIANEDRHLNNFGVIRQAESLKWIGVAPIFDSGSSFGYDKLISQIRSGKDIVCKPFKKRHEEQLKLVSDFKWIDFGKLKGIGEFMRKTYSDERAKELISENRISAIVEMTETRIEQLQTFAQNYEREEDTVKDDVEENISNEYLPKM